MQSPDRKRDSLKEIAIGVSGFTLIGSLVHLLIHGVSHQEISSSAEGIVSVGILVISLIAFGSLLHAQARNAN